MPRRYQRRLFGAYCTEFPRISKGKLMSQNAMIRSIFRLQGHVDLQITEDVTRLTSLSVVDVVQTC